MGYVPVGVCICGRELRPFIENKKARHANSKTDLTDNIHIMAISSDN